MSKPCSQNKLAFAKYEGAGNDFVLFDDRKELFPVADAALIRRLCHRRFGIGADGLILLQNHATANFCMRIFNCDGREAEGCGNGLRCLVQYLADERIAIEPVRVAVGGRILAAHLEEKGVCIEMGEMKNILHLSIDNQELHFVDSGVPHAVLFVPDIAAIPLATLAPPLRHHPQFAPHGANVSVAARREDGSVAVRTFERGVEGETLACGTGATAVAVLGHKLFGWKSPVSISYPGGDLFVHLDPVRLVGAARRTFEGIVIDSVS